MFKNCQICILWSKNVIQTPECPHGAVCPFLDSSVSGPKEQTIPGDQFHCLLAGASNKDRVEVCMNWPQELLARDLHLRLWGVSPLFDQPLEVWSSSLLPREVIDEIRRCYRCALKHFITLHVLKISIAHKIWCMWDTDLDLQLGVLLLSLSLSLTYTHKHEVICQRWHNICFKKS